MRDDLIDWSGGPDAAGKVTVNTPSQAMLLADLERRLRAGQGATVATLNLDHLVKLGRDPAFRSAYLAHSHVTADGRPVVWLSRMAGREVELTAGSDLVGPVCGLAAAQGWPVAFFGTTEPALDGAADRLRARNPGLDIALRLAPPMGFDPDGPEAGAAIARISASGARICLLALGAPKQERFAARAARDLPAVAFLSIGAGLDFWAGTQRRAPALARRLAAEWLWRLGQNPRRLARRYADCLAILPGQAVSARRARRGRAG